MRISITFVTSAVALLTSVAYAAPQPVADTSVYKRQTGGLTPDGTCGGTARYRCPTTGNRCCSQHGWCGSSVDHCGTGCQTGFGTCGTTTTTAKPTTTTTAKPTTTTTSTRTTSTPVPPKPTQTTKRPEVGNLPYGIEITQCTVPGTVALTYDDGPYRFTPQLLDLLADYNAKATFFVNGKNWGPQINTEENIALVRRMDAAGHQIGSHTWSHADLGTITTTTAHNQMRTLEIELWKILGKYPTYMRPPYFSCGANCRTVMKQLGYHIIFASVDTKDFENNTPSTNTIAQQNFNRAISAGNPRTSSFNVLSHDVHETTVTMLTKYMLDRIRTLGYRAVTIGECLNDPKANWYRTNLNLEYKG